MTRVLKSSVRASELREKGNIFFAAPENLLIKALELYDQSICFALPGSEHLAFGYANRSAIYLRFKLYDLCLANIELARDTGGYPDRLIGKLKNRELQCKQLMMTESKNKGPLKPKLSHPANKTVPFIVDCLELQQNKRYGRHIIANRNLEVGEIIAIEDPFCSVLNRDRPYKHCEHCHKENF